MISSSNTKYPELEVRTEVHISILGVDLACGSPRNELAVVTKV